MVFLLQNCALAQVVPNCGPGKRWPSLQEPAARAAARGRAFNPISRKHGDNLGVFDVPPRGEDSAQGIHHGENPPADPELAPAARPPRRSAYKIRCRTFAEERNYLPPIGFTVPSLSYRGESGRPGRLWGV